MSTRTNSGPTRPKAEFLAGVRDQLPILLGVVPFGLIFGALAISVGVPPLAAQGFSLLVFAGSSQFIAVGLIGEMAPAIVIIVTIFVVNLRHALYSASMSPNFARLRLRWKLSLSWLLTDEAFATASARYRRSNTASAHWYTLGTGLTLWTTWQLSTALGIFLGGGIPASFPLAFALPLTFIALLVPTLVDRPTVIAAASAGIVALILNGLPLKLGLMLGTLVGIAIGVWMDRKSTNVES